MTGMTRRKFLGFADRLGARPGGFAADIEDVRALRNQFQRVGNGGARIQKISRHRKRNRA